MFHATAVLLRQPYLLSCSPALNSTALCLPAGKQGASALHFFTVNGYEKSGRRPGYVNIFYWSGTELDTAGGNHFRNASTNFLNAISVHPFRLTLPANSENNMALPGFPLFCRAIFIAAFGLCGLQSVDLHSSALTRNSRSASRSSLHPKTSATWGEPDHIQVSSSESNTTTVADPSTHPLCSSLFSILRAIIEEGSFVPEPW